MSEREQSTNNGKTEIVNKQELKQKQEAESRQVAKIREEIRKRKILEREAQAKKDQEKKIEKNPIEVASFLAVVAKEYGAGLGNEQWSDIDQLAKIAKEDSQKGKQAKECLSDLTKAICKEMQDSTDLVIKEAVQHGIFSIDEVLPDGLRGDVAINVFKEAVPNKGIRNALNMVDAHRYDDGTIEEKYLKAAEAQIINAKVATKNVVEEEKIRGEALVYLGDKKKLIPIPDPDLPKGQGQTIDKQTLQEIIQQLQPNRGRRGEEAPVVGLKVGDKVEKTVTTTVAEEEEDIDRMSDEMLDNGEKGSMGAEEGAKEGPSFLESPLMLRRSELHNLFGDGNQLLDIRNMPDWYRYLPVSEREKYDIMIKIHNAAVHVRFWGNENLEKLRKNQYFGEGISQKELGFLFNLGLFQNHLISIFI